MGSELAFCIGFTFVEIGIFIAVLYHIARWAPKSDDNSVTTSFENHHIEDDQ